MLFLMLCHVSLFIHNMKAGNIHFNRYTEIDYKTFYWKMETVVFEYNGIPSSFECFIIRPFI